MLSPQITQLVYYHTYSLISQLLKPKKVLWFMVCSIKLHASQWHLPHQSQQFNIFSHCTLLVFTNICLKTRKNRVIWHWDFGFKFLLLWKNWNLIWLICPKFDKKMEKKDGWILPTWWILWMGQKVVKIQHCALYKIVINWGLTIVCKTRDFKVA